MLETKELLNSSSSKTKRPAGSLRYEMEDELLLEMYFITLPFFVKQKFQGVKPLLKSPSFYLD
jgi:hypothetical protein